MDNKIAPFVGLANTILPPASTPDVDRYALLGLVGSVIPKSSPGFSSLAWNTVEDAGR